MIWLGIFIGLIIGIAVGAALYRQLMSDTVKVQDLEEQLDSLKKEHESYQHQVHTHFDTSAGMFKTLTSNYRELYRHLSSSARQLCPETVYTQLSMLGKEQDILGDSERNSSQQRLFDDHGNFAPPRDYAVKSPDQKGNLSEDYGLQKVQPQDDQQV